VSTVLPLTLAAQAAVARATVLLLLSDGAPEPDWLAEALVDLADLLAQFWRERQRSPSRARLRASLVRLRQASADVEHLCRDSPCLTAVVARRLSTGSTATELDHLIRELSGHGQADGLDRFHWPSPKLLTACTVIALCLRIRGAPPGPKNRRAAALCSALLELARERVGDFTPTGDQRVMSWRPSLDAARRVYTGEAVPLLEDMNVLNFTVWQAAWRNSVLHRARKMIDDAIEQAIQRQAACGPGATN
jgi:hypothetical protein